MGLRRYNKRVELLKKANKRGTDLGKIKGKMCIQKPEATDVVNKKTNYLMARPRSEDSTGLVNTDEFAPNWNKKGKKTGSLKESLI